MQDQLASEVLEFATYRHWIALECTVRNPERQSAFIHADWNLERRIYPDLEFEPVVMYSQRDPIARWI